MMLTLADLERNVNSPYWVLLRPLKPVIAVWAWLTVEACLREGKVL